MNGKAEIAITTIIIVVIALLVLVVLIGVFTGQFGGFTTAVKDCSSKGGTCRTSCYEDEVKYFGTGMCKDSEKATTCCLTLSKGCIPKANAEPEVCNKYATESECTSGLGKTYCKWVS